MSYREFHFFSAALDADAVRLSLADGAGREYYAIVPAAIGRVWRERKEAALNLIEDAMVRRELPGEVRV